MTYNFSDHCLSDHDKHPKPCKYVRSLAPDIYVRIEIICIRLNTPRGEKKSEVNTSNEGPNGRWDGQVRALVRTVYLI